MTKPRTTRRNLVANLVVPILQAVYLTGTAPSLSAKDLSSTMQAEKAESISDTDQAGPPAPVGFFDPALKEVRKRVFYQCARTGITSRP